MFQENYFSGKCIIIAGAASGIGKSSSILLDSLGAKLILIDINENALKGTSQIMNRPYHKQVLYDFRSHEGIENMIQGIIDSNGPIDGLVYTVGVRSRRPLSLLKSKHVNEILATNLVSFIELVRVVAKKGNFHEGMSIVGISSVAAQRGSPGITAYAASKAALDGSIRCLAKELFFKKIRINTIVPGQIKTEEYDKYMNSKEGSEDEVLNRQYLGLGEPVDAANLILFLLSDSSRMISGSAVPLDGGYLSA